jgi:hypothetical protein
LKTGQVVELSGVSSLSSGSIHLVYVNGDFTENFTLTTDETGAFIHEYVAKAPGDWSVQAVYEGDDLKAYCASEPVHFTKYPVSIDCELFEISVRGTQKAEVRGSSSLTSAPIDLEFTNGARSRLYHLTTQENGQFNYKFTPDALGVWSVKAIFNGDAYEAPASSEVTSFSYYSLQTHVSALLNPSAVKLGKPITISGSVAPQVEGLPVEVLFVSSSSSYTNTVYTDFDGRFTCVYEPDEVGIWNVLSSVGDGLIYAKTNKLLEFEVLQLNIFDKVLNMALMMLVPPYSYGAIGIVFVGFSSVLYVKRDTVMKYLPESLAKRFTSKKSKKKKKSKGGATRYRRK